MSEDQPAQAPQPQHAPPFGYSFPGPSPHLTRNNSSSSQPPTGPPLLDHNEHDILQSFFDNPNNVDPAYLQMNEQYNNSNAIFSDQNMPWAMNTESQAQAMSTHSPHMQFSPEAHMRSASNGYGQVVSPSDPMFAAARVLSEGGHHLAQPPQHINQHGSQHHHSGSLGSFSGPVPPFSPIAFQFTGNGTGTTNGDFSQYNQQRLSGQSGPPTTDINGTRFAPQAGMTRPAGPLKFGSDDSFRNNGYTGPKMELPDRVFQAVAAHNLQPIDTRKAASAATGGVAAVIISPESPKRKRQWQNPPSAAIASDSGGDLETPITEGDRNAKRRKSKAKRETDEDYEERPIVSQAPKTKPRKRHSVALTAPGATAASAAAPTPGDVESPDTLESPSGERRRSSVSGSKPPRENLTEEQKRSNHIQSEQKRRNLIKQGFEDLNRMVPELRAGGFSKSNMLIEAARFMEKLQRDNAAIRQILGVNKKA